MMRHIMVCISGWAGTGKDECSGRLVNRHGAIHTGLADPGKRHLKDAYEFSNEQLWGQSKFRNAGDTRYPKNVSNQIKLKKWEGDLPDIVNTKDKSNNWYLSQIEDKIVEKDVWYAEQTSENKNDVVLFDTHNPIKDKPFLMDGSGIPKFFVREGDPDFWLSPREALQKYMELMNTLYSDTWIRKGIKDHRLIATNRYTYSKTSGLMQRTRPMLNVGRELSDSQMITCFSDFRHVHEHRLVRESTSDSLTPVLIRIKRPTVMKPPFSHRSETEQTRIRDEAYDFIINNDSSLEHLYQMIDDMIETVSRKDWRGKIWDPSFVLPDEGEGYSL